MENKITTAEQNLQRKLEWQGRYDTRISFVAGISIAMLGILATASSSINQWNCTSYSIFGISFGFLFTSLILIYISQYPKTEAPNSSLIYFSTIAALEFDEFKRQFIANTDEAYLEDLLYQTHVNARILHKKFKLLKISLVLIILAIIPWMGAIYLSKIYGIS